jgi:hypothetical protein
MYHGRRYILRNDIFANDVAKTPLAIRFEIPAHKGTG